MQTTIDIQPSCLTVKCEECGGDGFHDSYFGDVQTDCETCGGAGRRNLTERELNAFWDECVNYPEDYPGVFLARIMGGLNHPAVERKFMEDFELQYTD